MQWIDAIVQGVLLGGLYALFATGLSLIFGVMKLVNLAHGDLAILAAYLAVSLVSATGVSPLLLLLVVVPIMFVLGYVLQRVLLNRTLRGGVLPPLLVTFGIAIIIQNVLLEIYSADSRRLALGSIETASLRITSRLSVGIFPLITFGLAVILLVGLELFFSRTLFGRALRATSDDGEAAQLMGINDRHLYAVAMGMALAIVGVAGVFDGIRTTFGPVDGPAILIFGFEAVIIGGLGSLWGTLVGGIVLGVAQNLGAQVSPGWALLAGHIVFLVILLLRPTGLFSQERIRA
jgi:branched-chain amino acid transport system permease protein